MPATPKPPAQPRAPFVGFLDEINEDVEAQKVGAILENIRNGQRLEDFDPELAKDVRFYVLGLAPNAARLSIRFWYEDDLRPTRRKLSALRPRTCGSSRRRTINPNPPLWRYLVETAVLRKRDNVPPNLAGDWMRAILTGTRYPLTLLSTVLMRIRADGEVNALRAAMLKAVLNRNSAQFKGKVPVALDTENTEQGLRARTAVRRLRADSDRRARPQRQRDDQGQVLRLGLGAAAQGVCAARHGFMPTICPSWASKRPAIASTWRSSSRHHGRRCRHADDPFPASLSAEQQALFALGYYHQRSEFFQAQENR